MTDFADRISEMDIQETRECIDEMINVLTTIDECIAVIGHLEKALETRDVIGQAKGILMAQQGITADEAFDILRRASQRSNVKLREVAAEIAARVASHGRP